jgi:hypothetical protein
MYVLACWKAFRNFVIDLIDVVAVERDVKKLFAPGLPLWKARDGRVRKVDLDATVRVEVSVKGFRNAKAILKLLMRIELPQLRSTDRWELSK